MLKLIYKDETGSYQIAAVVTNHSMSINDILQLSGVDMNQWADDQGWDGWDWDNLEIIAE